MRPSEFCYWLQGYFELSNAEELTVEQINEIKKHLRLVCHPSTPTKDVSKYLQDLPPPPPTIESIYNRHC